MKWRNFEPPGPPLVTFYRLVGVGCLKVTVVVRGVSGIACNTTEPQHP